MFPPPIEAGPEVEKITSIVGKHFTISNVRYSPPEAVFIYVNVGAKDVEGKFDEVRKEMVPQGYIPFLTKENDEHVIIVSKTARRKFFGLHLNLVLFVLTIITTIISGSVSYVSYVFGDRNLTTNEVIAYTFRPENLAFGALVFALPLMLILGIHEFGHYYMARKNNVNASLPFFLPMPPFISPLGTLGAFISIRDPIPSKKALMDIGAAGPIAGFIIAIPVTLIGMQLTVSGGHSVPPDSTGSVELGASILYYLLALAFPTSGHMIIHPTAFAGWVGLLVTALNLLPAGQLDGGHIVRALLGPKTRWLSIAMIMLMFVAGFLFFPSWIFFAFFVMLFGFGHPPPLNDISPIDSKRKIAGVFCIVLLIITFVPEPMKEINPIYSGGIEFVLGEPFEKNASLNSTVTFNFTVKNTGTAKMEVNVTVNSILDLEYRGLRESNSTANHTTYYRSELALNETRYLTLTFFVPNRTDLLNKTYASRIVLYQIPSDGSQSELDTLSFRIHVR